MDVLLVIGNILDLKIIAGGCSFTFGKQRNSTRWVYFFILKFIFHSGIFNLILMQEIHKLHT